MIRFLLITPLLVFHNFVVAQTFFEQEYVGFLETHDKVLITYNLYFICNSFECNGFSISDLNGPNETKSEILGKIDFNEDIIYFEEKNVIYTKADIETYDEFCLVHFSIRRNTDIKNLKKTIKTNYIGYFEDGIICSKGKIQMSAKSEFVDKISKLQKKISRIKTKSNQEDSIVTLSKSLIDSISQATVLKQKKIYSQSFSYTPSLKLFLKDMGINDNDMIEIITTKGSERISLSKNPFEINIEPDDVIQIKAIDEGDSPSIPIKLVAKDIFSHKTELEEIIVLRKNQTFTITIK